MSILSPQSSFLPNIACGIAVIPLGAGILGLIRGRHLLPLVNFPLGSTPEAQKADDSLTRLFAVRNVVIASLMFSIRYRGDRQLLGAATIIMSMTALVDGLVSLDWIGGGTLNHLPFVPFAIAVGSGLLGWLG
ncbi:hypothetical protein BT63DRAFT_427352 [Microthyrium microscopicum]|uniref:Integral membrane protein n=1 Tax=Microthyrium microscopicum TaxID=703497 RepID=A0A6A6U6L7_9PEZI|nr:hypothetical protein BT63DRAFT_427352 [Microthyrium microscopicum]